MLLRRLGLVFAASVCIAMVTAGPTSAQLLVEVSITGATEGLEVHSCTAATTLDPPTFELTRTGDTTGTLDVDISWSGTMATETAVSPTVAEFAAGSATTTVTPSFASVPTVGTLSLTVEDGPGYEPDDPVTLSATFGVVTPSCVAPPLAPPPIVTSPAFTG
jgi:hypothetical protein